jgi:hypothetical protein
MSSILEIRKEIDNDKKEYNRTNNKYKLLHASILKGLYVAKGGRKGIALPSRYEVITIYSKVIFKYKIKLDTVKSQEMAFNYLYNELVKLDKKPEYFLDGIIPVTEHHLAKLLASLVASDYADDIIINQEVIYNTAVQILKGGIGND